MSAVKDEDEFAEFEVEGQSEVVDCLLQATQTSEHCHT